jgi:hypothetical protein
MCVHTVLLGVLKVDLTIVLPSLNAILMINTVQDILLSILLTKHHDTFLLVISTLAHHPGMVLNEARARPYRHLP